MSSDSDSLAFKRQPDTFVARAESVFCVLFFFITFLS